MTHDPNAPDKTHYKKLVETLEADYGTIQLPSEYAYLIQENLTQFLIRLSRYKFASRLIRPRDQVLEIGCGTGLGSIFLAQHCRSVLGIDSNRKEIGAAESVNKRDNVNFENVDFFDFSNSTQFDVVVSLDVIEHLSEARGIEFMKQTTRHLNERGMIILGTPSCYSYEYSSDLSKAAHIKMYDQNELIRLMESFYSRVISFSMNDEIVHTGHPKMAWYYFVLGFLPQN